MKLADVKTNPCIDSSKEINDEGPKLKIGDLVRLLKYKSIFAKGYAPNWSEVFMIFIGFYIVPWTYVINDVNGEEIVGTLYKKEFQNQIKRVWN